MHSEPIPPVDPEKQFEERLDALEEHLAQAKDDLAAQERALAELRLARQASRSSASQSPPPEPGRAERGRALRSNWKAFGLLLLILAAALLPSILVVRERWLGLESWDFFTSEAWAKSEFLTRTALPGYFASVLAATAALFILVFVYRGVKRIPAGSGPSPEIEQAAAAGDASEAVSPTRRALLWMLAGVVLSLVSVVASLWLRQVLDWGFLLAILLYVVGWLIQENPFRPAWLALQRNSQPLLAFLTLHAALLGWIVSRESTQAFRWWLLLLVALAASTWRDWRRIPPIGWIFNLGLACYAWNLHGWQFSIIGDEYAFFNSALEVATRHDLGQILGNLFNGSFVYGSHPYLSSLIQAISMRLFGLDGFGWRFSNATLCALALVAFYFFFKHFVGTKKATLAALLLAASVYLMTFGKVGYNNLHAYLAMGVALAAASWAILSRKEAAFVGLGLSLGLCFYVYPATLYILPLPLLLLLLYLPLRSRKTWFSLAWMAIALLLCVAPLLLQPEYWASKKMGLVINSPEIVQTTRGAAQHVFSNFIDAAYSFLYTPQESHLVPVGYTDPLTAAFILIGLALTFRGAPHKKFNLFAWVSLILLLVLAGVSHDRQFPPTTRMFLLLPLWVYFAVEGLSWLAEQTAALQITRQAQRLLAVLVVIVIALNLYQAYGLSLKRNLNYQSLESLFLGIVQRGESFEPTRVKPLTFLFLTNPDWGIDGLHTLLHAYPYPASRVRLAREVVLQPILPLNAYSTISERDTLVILQPEMDAQWQEMLGAQLKGLGKESCEIKESSGQDTRFRLWYTPGLQALCDFP